MKFLLLFLPFSLLTAQFTTKSIPLLPAEKWYGGRTADAHLMPLDSGYTADLRFSDGGSVQPLLLSNQGRYLYGQGPFKLVVTDSTLEVIMRTQEKVDLARFGKDLASVQQFVGKHLLNFRRGLPNVNWFERPRYPLPGKLGQTEVLAFAEEILARGLPAGTISLGDGWQETYGNWRFRATDGSYPEAAKMISRLHELGFHLQVTLHPWMSLAEAKRRYETGRANVPGLMDPNQPKSIKGYALDRATGELTYHQVDNLKKSDIYLPDFSHPETQDWLKETMGRLTDSVGVDGFHFAGGDFNQYAFVVSHRKNLPGQALSLRYLNLADRERMDLLETDFGRGGQHLGRGLGVKIDGWPALQKLLPTAKLMELMGYHYYSPPALTQDTFDAELLIRYVQAQQFLPMLTLDRSVLQLNDEQLNIIKSSIAARKGWIGYLAQQLNQSMNRYLPMVTDLNYYHPEAEQAADQFLFGEDILVAPVLSAGRRKRSVLLPAGNWQLRRSQIIYSGGQTIEVAAPLEELVYFVRMDGE